MWASFGFLFLLGLLDGENTTQVTPLAKGKASTELSLLPCIVKACQPNGLGDMKITVKVNISYDIQYLLYLAPIVTNLFLVYHTGSHCKC